MESEQFADLIPKPIECRTVGDLMDQLELLPRAMPLYEHWESHSPGHPLVWTDQNRGYYHAVPFDVWLCLVGSE